ncbi:MAG: hypothetical protein ABI693_26015 [Bryobacteraceae bacterium]
MTLPRLKCGSPLGLSLVALFAGSLTPAALGQLQIPPPPPATYQSLFTSLQSQIDTFQGTINTGWNGSKSPVVFSAEMLTVNSNNGLKLLSPNVPNTYREELRRLKSTGVQAVTFNIAFPIFYQPFYDYNGDPADYQKFVDFYKQVVVDVRGAGLKVIIETSPLFTGYYSQGSGLNVDDYYKTLSLTGFTNARGQNAVVILQQVQPDFLNLGSEPDTQASITGLTEINTPGGYATYISAMLSMIDAAGARGSTKVGAGVGTWLANGSNFVTSVVTTGIDYLDIHIYPVNRNFLQNALTFADAARQAGKPTAMSEAWLLKESDAELATGNVASDPTIYSRDAFSFWAPLDQKFLSAMVDMSHWKGFLYTSAFWSRYFWAYLDYTQYASQTSDDVTTAAAKAAAAAIPVATSFTSTYTMYQSLVAALSTVSAASFSTGVQAPDSIVSLFGPGLATSLTVAPDPLNLPTALNQTSVTITDSSNIPKPMGLYFISSGQINAVIPSGLAAGGATINVLAGATTVLQAQVTLAPVVPAFFTANQNGQGVPAAAIVTNTTGGAQLRDVAFQCTGGAGTCTPKPINVGVPGESVALELYGTGIRNVSSLSNVTAIVGSTAVQVIYAGPQSQYAGFDQVDVILPPSLAGAGTVNLTLTADGVPSNVVTIAIQ